MLAPQNVATGLFFVPLAISISYMDVRYRRIPNNLVLLTLMVGLIVNTIFGGTHGLLASLGGSALAFALMFLLHTFGTLGAGDVKLFAAIGAVLGSSLVLPTLVVVALTGGALAICQMVYSRRVGTTLFGVFQVFLGLVPRQKGPRFEVPGERGYKLAYAVPIC